MKNKLIVVTIASLFLVSCNEAKEDEINVDNLRAGVAESQAINEKLDRQKNNSDFFASEDYPDSKEEEECIDENLGNFSLLETCLDYSIDNLNKRIKEKLTNLKKSPVILEQEYKKIHKKCLKKQTDVYGEDYDDENSLLKACIKTDLYQFGRNLK